jgi:hypothetical protein
MNERERWIVYPLLFFALGAALRDKFLQRVTTDELIAKRIVCEDLAVRDPAKHDRVVAKLTSNSPPGQQDENADRFGVLALIDSQGQELCGVTNNALQVRQIGCDELVSQRVAVVDPQNAQRRLALLTSATARLPEGQTRRVGSLLLTDHEGTAIFGLANDQMEMRSIACQGIAVVDPQDSSRVLAVLGSGMVKSNQPGSEPRRLGVLQLNDQRFIGLTGDPTQAPVDSPPPPKPAETAADASEPDAAVSAAEPEATPEPNGPSAAADEQAADPADGD